MECPTLELHKEINASELLQSIQHLEVPTLQSAPATIELEHRLKVGPQYGRATYREQKHHWVRWLTEYQPPDKSARLIYNAINCPTMLFWLSEALAIEQHVLKEAMKIAIAAPSKQTSQTAAIRRVLPWTVIVEKIRSDN